MTILTISSINAEKKILLIKEKYYVNEISAPGSAKCVWVCFPSAALNSSQGKPGLYSVSLYKICNEYVK